MKVIAVTHPEKNPGVNPCLTDKGIDDMITIREKLPWNTLKNAIVGTGKRFNDMLVIIKCGLVAAIESVKFSPLLGSADSGKKTETGAGMDVILADGTQVPLGQYIGLIGTPGIDLWAWLKSLPEGTLLLTGREFVGALGVKDAQMAEIYIIDTESMVCEKYTNPETDAG